MRWLLITTRPGLNPGDQFIRIGVERLIRIVDRRAEFDVLAKDDGEDLLRRRPFDRAVLCGMPLFWNNPTSASQDEGWWGELIRGWPSENRRRFLVLGAGSAVGLEMPEAERYLDAIRWVIGRSYAVTTRNPVVDWPFLTDSICPAAFALPARTVETPAPRLRLFNAMRNGAHDRHFNPGEADAWTRRLPRVAAWARENAFAFVAHDDLEADLGRELGFETVFRTETPEELLEIYANCGAYVGNRLHGAMAAASAGARVAAIGYDSRMRMLDRLNVAQFYPREACPAALSAFLRAEHAPDFALRTIRREFDVLLQIVARFAAPE